jgi:hypothetical protein
MAASASIDELGLLEVLGLVVNAGWGGCVLGS